MLVVCSCPASAQAPQLRERFYRLLASEYKALSQGDTAILSKMLADDLVWVGPTGRVINKTQLVAVAAKGQTPTPKFDVDSLRVSMIGNTAIAQYRRTDHRDLGTYRTQTANRVLDVFRQRGNHWVLARHTQTWIVSGPTAVTLDSAALNAFVGRYEIGPGYVDNVHWREGHLVAQSTVESIGATLIPVSNTAFSPDGIAPLIVFERDKTGRVIGYVQQIQDGRVVCARRLPTIDEDTSNTGGRPTKQ